MPLSLVRIDDRLIHGQVVLGWARVLKPDRIVVGNDRISRDTRLRRINSLGVPGHMKVSFLTIDETARELLNNLYKNESIILLFESVEDTYRVIEKGVRFQEINIGGLHFKEGTEELLPYVFLSPRDKELLRELVKRGVRLVAQDIPGNPARVINSLVV